MQPVSVFCIFCEDIRREFNEVNTVVGLMPDNINVESLPAFLPKLGLYIRINMDPQQDPGSIKLSIAHPNANETALSEIDPQLIATARSDAIRDGAPVAGIISRTVFQPFQLLEAGRIRVLATIRGEPVLCGSLNIRLKPKAPDDKAS